MKDSLNVTNERRDDWRGVAARMGIKATTIEKFAKDFKENPTDKLFQELSSKKTTELLQVLYQMDLHDVLNIFYDNMCINKPGSLPLCKMFQHLSNKKAVRFLIY